MGWGSNYPLITPVDPLEFCFLSRVDIDDKTPFLGILEAEQKSLPPNFNFTEQLLFNNTNMQNQVQ